jgi:acetylornithine deacetylase/succinyl-diaminopimelate desuccinylase-like protein
MPHGKMIDAMWEESILPALSEYTRIECLSPAFDADWAERGAITAAAELLLEWTRAQAGAPAIEIVQLPGRTPVLFADTGGTGDPILLYGHMDKQPPLGEWRDGLSPFEPVRQGDLLYGRGTADDGYSLFAAVTGLLAVEGGRGRVVILIEASEESGSPDLSAYVAHLQDRIGSPSLVICLDSGCLSYDRLWLTSSLRGNLVADIRVQVLTEGVHSGGAGGVVPSSFRILRRILSRIEDEVTGEIILPELRGAGIPDEHRAHLAADAQEFPDSAFPLVEGLRLLEESPVDRLIARSWSPALEVIGMDGIPAVRDGGNVLRPYTTAKI